MRSVSIIAAAARFVAIVEVRVINGIESSVNRLDLRLNQQRMHLGMPSYSGSTSSLSLRGYGIGGFQFGTINADDRERTWLDRLTGLKRGNLQHQLNLVSVSCQRPIGRTSTGRG